MTKRNFLCSFLIGFFVVFATSFTSIQTTSAAMCGADNSGACQIACTGSQGSIGDPTNKCTGFGSGGTVCCSPADQSQYEWPSSQCTALGGRNAIGSCDDIANTFDGGALLTLDCNPSGRCCLPSGVFNASNPLPKPQACVAANCTDTPGGACRVSCNGGETPSGAGVCRGADAGKTCCIPGGGGICQTKGGVCVSGSCASDNRESNSAGGSCVGADAGKTCCSATQNTSSAPVGALNYTLLEEIPGSTTGVTGNLATYLQNLYKFTFWAIGVAALFMLTVGGFMYVTSAGNTSRVETAKTIITDSLLGIIVALFAWLFLYVINPDLVEGLQLPNTVSTTTGGASPGTPPTTGSTCSTPNTSSACCPQSATITCGACTDCVAIPASVPNKGCGLSTCFLNSGLLAKIQAISGVSGWRITESWPPTVKHLSLCHTKGTCADINNSGGATDPDTIKRYHDAFKAAGLDVLYENSKDCAPYTALGINCRSYPTQTNLSSFHVY